MQLLEAFTESARAALVCRLGRAVQFASVLTLVSVSIDIFNLGKIDPTYCCTNALQLLLSHKAHVAPHSNGNVQKLHLVDLACL